MPVGGTLIVLLLLCWTGAAAATYGIDASFDNQVVRAVVVVQPPFVMPTSDGSSFEGLLVDLVAGVLAAAGANNSLVMYASPDGKKTGLVDELAAGRADVGLSDLTLSPELLLQAAVPSTPYLSTPYAILVEYPQSEDADPIAFMDPFTPRLWVLVFCSVLAIGFVLWAFEAVGAYSYASQYHRGEEPHYYSNLSNSLSNAFVADFFRKTGTPGYTGKSLSFRLVVVPFFFFSFIILASYSGNLASRLILNPVQLTATDIQSLVYGQTPFAVVNGSDAHAYFTTIVDDPLTLMAATLMSVYPDYAAAVAALRSKQVEALISNQLLHNYTLLQPPCGALYMSGTFGQLSYPLLYAPSFALRQAFNVHIPDLYPDDNVARWLARTANCPNPTPQVYTGSVRQLDIPTLAGLWYMMIIAAAIALIVLVAERIVYSRRIKGDSVPPYFKGRPWMRHIMKFLGDRSHLLKIIAAGGLERRQN